MNRVIKFRGWNTEQKVMYSAEELAEDQLTLLTTGKFINVDGDNKNNSEIYDHIIPLQFTGLLDRNGKEVYEGDLVKHNKLGSFEIKFYEGSYRMGIILLYFYIKEVEVIGNIYETSTTS